MSVCCWLGLEVPSTHCATAEKCHFAAGHLHITILGVLQLSASGSSGSWFLATAVTWQLSGICHSLLPERVWRQGYFRFVMVTALVHSLLPLAPSVRSKLSHNWNSKLLSTFLFPFPLIPEVASFLFPPPSGNNICPFLLSRVPRSISHTPISL